MFDRPDIGHRPRADTTQGSAFYEGHRSRLQSVIHGSSVDS
jgi:hypothetical protein